jgi:hypothetical protein
MPEIIFKIPIRPWIQGTITRMRNASAEDVGAWNRHWLATYRELGGKSKASGSKGCLRKAAYGLWRLGRVAAGGKQYQNSSLDTVNREFGKNATYALLTLRFLADGRNPDAFETLWSEVKREYRLKFRDQPADSEQGALRLTCSLFKEGQLILISKQ